METLILPETTIVVLLGASEWPEAEDLQGSPAFKNSAMQVASYFLDSFGLPNDNLLNLFDSDDSQEYLLRQTDDFIRRRMADLQTSKKRLTDIVVYFTGHGGFEGSDSDYFLVVKHSTDRNYRASAINVHALALTLKTAASSLRQLIILDACFASSATAAFQSSAQTIVVKQIKNAFYESGLGNGECETPTMGTTLLCSSSPHVPSKIADDHQFTMFTHGLLHVLNQGSVKARAYLSVADVNRLVWDFLGQTYKDKAPRPEVHSPNQSTGDIANVPYFPNLALLNRKAGLEKRPFTFRANTVQCCIILSETEQETKALYDVVSGMLIEYKGEILRVSGKTEVDEGPYLINVTEALSSIDSYRNVIAALCQTSVAIFDLTNYEPAVMYFLGIRSVVRRGVTVATYGGDYVIGDTINFPFNIKDVNIISHSEKQLQVKNRDPIDIIGQRVVEGYRQLLEMPDYLDLPTFDAIRNVRMDTSTKEIRDWSKTVLLLCSFSKEYQDHNWLENINRFLPIHIKSCIQKSQDNLTQTKPEIIRTLDIKTPRLVSSSLYEAIRLTNMCVIDWTEWRPNVFFELGTRVAANDYEPVCIIEQQHKVLITRLATNENDWDTFECPKGIAKVEIERLATINVQCKQLLAWFNPIEYRLATKSTGYDKAAFLNMVAFFDNVRQTKSNPSEVATSIEKDSTYNIISKFIDWEVESSSRPAYTDLINQANMMSSPELDSQGESPVLYPENDMLVQKAEEGALERRIAAWLYVDHRYTIEEISADEKLKIIYTDLTNIILRKLLDRDNPRDIKLIELLQAAKTQLRRLKKQNQ